MLRLVRNLALGAALLTVAVAVWRDYGVMITLRRAVLAYLATFFLAGGLGLIAVIGLKAYQPPPPPPPEDPRAARKRKREAAREREAAAGPADLAPPTPEAPPAPETAPAAPVESVQT